MKDYSRSLALLSYVFIGFLLGASAARAQDAVPPAICGTCHASILAKYKESGMGRSFYRAAPASIPLQRAPYFHAPSGTNFALVRKGAKVYHRRWQTGADGAELYLEELPIDYVMGSGRHALTFLHRNARGALIELPLGWYSENGGYFAMNPGFDNPRPATRRKIDYDCMSCHNAAPRIPAGHSAPGAEPLFAGELPNGIDCERCHGPGGRHVAAARMANGRPENIRGSIVNPARLPPARQDDVCLQCHLETTSGPLPSIIRRFERAPFSYRPGEPLERFALHFDHAPGTGYADKFEIVSAAYRLRKSACYLNSPALTCTSCHNPHAKTDAPGCAKCHSAKQLLATGKHPAGTGCAGCHMPKRRTEDAVHVVMTDHLIQRRPPSTGGLAERPERQPESGAEYRGEVVPYLQGDFLYNAVAQVLHGANLGPGIPRLMEALRLQPPKEPEYFVSLGNAWQQAQRPGKAVEAFEAALRLQPNSGRTLRFLGIALQESGNRERAGEALRRAIEVDPSDAVSWHQLGLLDSGAGRLQDAAAKAAKAIALDPDLLDARNSLGAALASLGDRSGSEKAFRDALRIDPYFATAHGNLARLLATKGEDGDARAHFATAVRLRPGFAPDRYEYALALVRGGRPADARIQVDAALRLSSEMLEARILSGGLWARERKLDLARREYEAALRIQPDSGRAHLDLARILVEQGERLETIAHLRAAAKSADAASAKLAAQALQNLGVSP